MREGEGNGHPTSKGIGLGRKVGRGEQNYLDSAVKIHRHMLISVLELMLYKGTLTIYRRFIQLHSRQSTIGGPSLAVCSQIDGICLAETRRYKSDKLFTEISRELCTGKDFRKLQHYREREGDICGRTHHHSEFADGKNMQYNASLCETNINESGRCAMTARRLFSSRIDRQRGNDDAWELPGSDERRL